MGIVAEPILALFTWHRCTVVDKVDPLLTTAFHIHSVLLKSTLIMAY